MQNNILIVISVILVVVVAIQSYFLYDIKKQIEPNNSIKNSMVMDNTKNLNTITPKDFFNTTISNNYDPFKKMQEFQQEVDEIFNNFNSHFMTHPSFKSSFFNTSTMPLSDFKDTGKGYEIKMNIPGSDKNSIKVHIKGNTLEVSSNVEKSNDENTSNYFRQERYMQTFYRAFTLPNDVNTNSLKQNYENGILTITLDKK